MELVKLKIKQDTLGDNHLTKRGIHHTKLQITKSLASKISSRQHKLLTKHLVTVALVSHSDNNLDLPIFSNKATKTNNQRITLIKTKTSLLSSQVLRRTTNSINRTTFKATSSNSLISSEFKGDLTRLSEAICT